MAANAESNPPSAAEVSAFEKIDDLLNVFKKTNVMIAAVKLGIFTAAHGGKRTAEELASLCGVHENKKLDALLDVLVADDLMVRHEDVENPCAPLYENGAGVDLLLGDASAPNCLQSVDLTIDHVEREMVSWRGLVDVLRTGKATHTSVHYKVGEGHDHGHHGHDHGHHGHDHGHHGHDHGEHGGCHHHGDHGGHGHHHVEDEHEHSHAAIEPKPKKLADCHDEGAPADEQWSDLYDIFEAYMRISFNLLAERFDFSKFSRVVDLGGGTAQLSRILTRRFANLHCTNFDFPRVQPAARKRMEALGQDVMDRVHLASGNCLTDEIPQPVDLIVAANIVHGFEDDATRKQLFRRAYDALRPGGAFMIVEEIMTSDRSNMSALLWQLGMQVDTESSDGHGHGRCLLTQVQFREWGAEVGFDTSHPVVPLVGSMCAMVAYRRR